jgi:hypothetical protein
MAPHLVARMTGPRLIVAAIAFGVSAVAAQADSAVSTSQQPGPDAQRAPQNPPPARVVLPAPWEQAVPVPPAAAPVEAAGRK